jgi:lipoprotein-releasing system permease protein
LNTSFYIARRYLFSKKSFNAINIISGISVLGVFVGSAALIIIISAFNGLEKIILSQYNTFTPELVIAPVSGKTFDPALAHPGAIRRDSRVLACTGVLQEKALVKYRGGQYIGYVKGVDKDYTLGKALDSVTLIGSFALNRGPMEYAVLGGVVQSYLGVNVNDDFSNLEIYSPRKGAANAADPASYFNVFSIHPGGVFSVQQKFDEVVIVPLAFARRLLEEDRNVSALEITLKDPAGIPAFKDELKKRLGAAFTVKDRAEQDQALYKTLNVEKLSIYVILSFVLVIAIFNIIGSLTMLVIDKKDDITILSSIGASRSLIRNIFFTEGMMIAMTGCLSGMLVGFLFSLAQLKYGFIKMGGPGSIVEAYPIGIRALDFVWVFLTVSVISGISSFISSRLSIRHLDFLQKGLG